MEDNKEINDLIDILIKRFTELKNENEHVTHNIAANVYSEDDIEVEADSGTPIKIDSRTYYRMIYADVNNLKQDTESLLNLYLDDVKPTLKSVERSVKDLSIKIDDMEKDLEFIKTHEPKTFGKWLEEKANFAKNFDYVFKIILYIVVFMWVISSALPAISHFISKFLGTN